MGVAGPRRVGELEVPCMTRAGLDDGLQLQRTYPCISLLVGRVRD